MAFLEGVVKLDRRNPWKSGNGEKRWARSDTSPAFLYFFVLICLLDGFFVGTTQE